MTAIQQVLALVLAITSHLGAAGPMGKPQQLTSPDQVPVGLAKSDWADIRAAYEAGRHAFQPVENGWQARNPGQQWITKFDGRGFVAQPAGGAWQWGLELKSYGFPGQERSTSSVPAVKADGQRLTYQWSAGIQEWFVNDPRGLEHGFTVSERPAAISIFKPRISDPLTITLGVRGGLRPEITADALGVRFLDDHGAAVLTYSGLKVWDADGKTLPSRFETAEYGLRLLVDERGARYPLTIDPIAQQAYLKASNTGADDYFGCSVAISGDTVIVGAFGEDSSSTGVNSTPNDSLPSSGAVYVFVRSGTTWTQQAYLKASNPGPYGSFGSSVTISGNTMVVGAPGEGSSTIGVNSTPNYSAYYYSGAAYVFTRSGTTWTQQAYLKASNTGENDNFGSSVAVSGDTVVVGAAGEDSSTTGVNSTPNDSAPYWSGAAYVFVRNGTAWTQQAYLKASNTGADDCFGYSVAVSDDTVVVGAYNEDSSTTGVNSTPNDSELDTGAAYVFTRSGSVWTQQAYLKASNTGRGDMFGYSVAVSGNTVVVGAWFEDSSTTGVNSTPNDSSGDSGAAYVFTRSGTAWTQQAYLKASNTGANDYFGSSVAVSGNTVVVGAKYEASSTTGVNSTPNESTAYAGAAYVFTRTWPVWTQVAYLKASSTGNDSFGTSVAVSGDTVLVGAYSEDSSTTGVNSTPNESATNSGAAYVFTGLGANTPPIVSAPTSANVTSSAATLGGYVISDGGENIIVRGVVFAPTSSNNNPKLGGSGVTNVTAPGASGVFTVDIGSLAPGTAYSFAAYAINGLGTSYSATGSFIVGLPGSPYSATYYVDISRPDDNGSGLNWAMAKQSLQSAINLASPGDSIIVANGTYPPISSGNKAISIQSLDGPEVTFIDGGMTNRCATLGGDPAHTSTILNGFTLRNGYSDDRGGGSAFGTLNHCILTGNLAGWRHPYQQVGYGGGAYYGSLNNCTLTGNSAYWYGGGAYESILNNCTISGNRSWNGAGTAYGTLNHCVLSYNFANRIDSDDSGSGGSAGGSLGGVLNNCYIFKNQAAMGGGSMYGVLNNCTLTENKAWFSIISDGGGALECTLNNCIVWGNIVSRYQNQDYKNYKNCVITYSCTTPLPSGLGNIETDPMLTTNGHFLAGSPCIDTGNNTYAQGVVDLDGKPRIFNGSIDMGAYEFMNTITLKPGANGYIAEANSGADHVTYLAQGAAFTPPTPVANKNWVFTGWSPEVPSIITSSLTATACYKGETYTVTFAPQGGMVNPTQKEVFYNSAYGSLPIPTCADAQFDGWWTEPNGGGERIMLDTLVATTASHTLYAKWDINSVLGTSGLTWTTGGDTSWFPQVSVVTADRLSAMQAGAITHSQTSWIETTIPNGGTLSFWWGVSAEAEGDVMSCTINGVVHKTLTANSLNWSQETLVLGDGPTTLRWTFRKNMAGNVGADSAWIAAFTWTPRDFALWADQHGLHGDVGALFRQKHPITGIPYGIQYAFGSNLPPGGPVMSVRSVNGHLVVETPEQDAATLSYVDVVVLGSTNLIDWTLPMAPSAGNPTGRSWYEPVGIPKNKSFFRLKVNMK